MSTMCGSGKKELFCEGSNFKKQSEAPHESSANICYHLKQANDNEWMVCKIVKSNFQFTTDKG